MIARSVASFSESFCPRRATLKNGCIPEDKSDFRCCFCEEETEKVIPGHYGLIVMCCFWYGCIKMCVVQKWSMIFDQTNTDIYWPLDVSAYWKLKSRRLLSHVQYWSSDGVRGRKTTAEWLIKLIIIIIIHWYINSLKWIISIEKLLSFYEFLWIAWFLKITWTF